VKKAKIDLEEREKKQKEGKEKARVEAQISEATLPTT